MANTPTTKFGLLKPDSGDTGWDVEMNDNLTIIDALLFSMFGSIAQFQGVWAVSTAYVVNDVVVDSSTGLLYICAVAHTSASSGAFSADRTSNPTYWNVFTHGASIVVPYDADIEAGSDEIVDTVFVSGYDYEIRIREMTPDTDAADARITFRTGGSDLGATTHVSAGESIQAGSANRYGGDDSYIQMHDSATAVGSDTGESITARITVFDPGSTGETMVIGDSLHVDDSGTMTRTYFGGILDAGAVDGFRIFFDTGNIEASGRITVQRLDRT